MDNQDALPFISVSNYSFQTDHLCPDFIAARGSKGDVHSYHITQVPNLLLAQAKELRANTNVSRSNMKCNGVDLYWVNYVVSVG